MKPPISVLVTLVVASCRFGYEAVELSEPSSVIASLEARPNTQGRAGEVRLEITLAARADVGSLARFEVRRQNGFVPPASCAVGDLVATETDASQLNITDSIAEPWERVHTYRVCAFSAADDEIGTATSAPSLYFNPGPGCDAPPCDTPRSLAAASGIFELGAANLSATSSIRGDAILADLNHDGALDIIVAAFGVNVIHYGEGDGSFRDGVPTSSRALESVAAVVGDFDRDGEKDVVFANGDGPSFLHRGLADGTLDTGQAIYAGTFVETFDVEAADLNGDDILDLIFARFGAQDLIYIGDGDGNFTFDSEVSPYAGESCVNCLTVADVDGDLRSDLVIGYNTGDERLQIFRGTGDADALLAAPISVGFGAVNPIAVRLADLDNDGDLDIVVTESQAGGVNVSLGDGGGGFSPLAAILATTVSRVYGLGLADFDGDGNIDIAISQDESGTVSVLPGVGGGNFGTQLDLDGGALFSTTNIEIGDVNGDGKLDILIGEASMSEIFMGR